MKAFLFALFVALLMAGCEESSTPSDPVDSPKAIDLDDKETREKIIAEAIDGDTLKKGGRGQERKLLYAPNEQTPYTGWLKVMYENGQIKVLGQLKDGKPSRLTQWYENGQKGSEEINKAGKNVTARWYENGNKAERFTVINGQKHGPWTSWYENGLKKAEVNWENGEMHGLMTFWYDNGQKKEEGIFKNSLKDGPRTEWYENAQKKAEGNFKDGKVVSAVVWKPNGEKCPVTYVEDGAGVVVNYNENGTVENRLAFEFGEGTLQNESQTVLRELDIARVAAGGYRKAEKKVFTYKDGPATDWHKNGQKKEELNFKDDRLISSKGWDEDGKTTDQSKPPGIAGLRKMAEAGSSKSQFELGVAYAQGNGVAKNELEAITWFRKAADQGYHPSQFALGAMHLKGQGVPKNEVGAVAWFVISAYYGNEKAKAAIEALSRSLEPEQVVEMQKLSKELFKRIEANKNDYSP